MVNTSKNQIELYPLGKDKDIIFKALMKNNDVVNLTIGESPTDTFIKHFFNSLFVDTTQLETKTYITMDTEIVSAENTKIKCIAIIIDIFTSLPLIPLSTTEQLKYYATGYFGNRIDCLLDAVKRTITDLNIGIGDITLAPRSPVKIIQPTEKYYGKRLTLHTYDF